MKSLYILVSMLLLVTNGYYCAQKKEDCVSGEFWSDCGELNCDNRKPKCPSYYENSFKCSPGCYCDKGLARQLGKCIPINKCKSNY